MSTRRFGLMLGLAAILAAPCATAAVSEITYQGKKCVLLENRFMRMVVSPADGGMVMEWVHKPTGKRFTIPGKGAMLGNRVWNYAGRDIYTQWERCEWDYEIRKAPGQASVMMRASGQEGFTRHTLFERELTLRDDESKVRVSYAFHVGQQLMVPQRIGLWFKNYGTIKGEPLACYFPLDDGTIALDQATGAGQSWYYNPARGWAAIAGVNTGTGLGFEMEYRRLMCFYMLKRGDVCCIEWAFRSADIPNGEALRTQGEVVVFSGLPAVHGVGGGIVAGLELPKDVTPAAAQAGFDAKAVLFGGQATKADLVITLQRLPDGQVQQVLQQALDLPVGKAVTVPLRLEVAEPGMWMVRGQVVQQGKALMDFTAPLRVGKTDTPYRVAPLEERIGRKSERFEDKIALRGSAPRDIELSTKIQSEHVAWAKPYRKGKLRVLVLTSFLTGREAVELAERLDMEIIWVTAGCGTARAGLPGVTNIGRHTPYTLVHENDYIKEKLKDKVDAIIVGGLRGSDFKADTLAAIKAKVEAGTGLVWVAPNRGEQALYDLLPVEKEKSLRYRQGQWKAVKPHFLTTGIPFEELPRTDYVYCKAKVDPLATVGRGPLLVASDGPGRGRVVALTYNTGWQGVGGYSTGITPWLRNARQKFHYWEYHFSLLCKALVWSAHREPDVLWQKIEVTADNGSAKLVAKVANSGQPLQAVADYTVSDAFGKVIETGQTPASIPAGASELVVPIKAALPDGLNLVDVILKADGKVVTWGTAAYHCSTGVRIDDLAFDKDVYHPDETAVATVTVSADATRAVRLDAKLTDSLGRLIGQSQQPVTAGPEQALTLRFPLGKPLATVGKLRVTLADQGKLLAAREGDFIMLPERFAKREWGDWNSQLWGNVAGAYGRDYLIPFWAQRLKDYGMDTMITSARWLMDTEYDSAVRAGFQIMVMGSCYGALRLTRVPKGKLTFAKARTAYAKTHDKKYLVRPVCLNSEQDLAPLAEKLHKLGEFAGRLEPIGYNLGDEMSITYYVTPFDYCFGDACLGTFRKWLQKRYPSLAALNKTWDTQFASWDAVMPMTALEAKGRGNFAPWAEHREFMDDTLQHFFRWVRARLRERDPRAGVGMSGSQAAEAYGGYDWSKLVYTLDFVQNYTHQNTMIMQRSFGANLNRAPWYGYMVRNPRMRRMLWQRFLNGNRGGAYFVIRYMFFPDGRPTVSTRDAEQVVHEMRNGLATLFMRLDRLRDIALHYSHPSIRAAFIVGDNGMFRTNRDGWVRSLRDLDRQCDFVCGKEMAAGELIRRGYKAVVLPYSMAMSKAEAHALRAYVEHGGLLLADVRPGLMDERCRTLPASPLDELFGIRRGKPNPLATRVEGDAKFDRDLGECKLTGMHIDVDLAEKDVQLAGAVALGSHSGAPVVIVNRVGKGAAVLLNFPMRSYTSRRELGMEADMRKIVANLLRLSNVGATVRVASAAKPKAKFDVMRFRSGSSAFVGIGHDPGKTKRAKKGEEPTKDVAFPITVTFPAAANVYDIRAGKFLGHTQSVDSTIRSGDAKLYAMLPYQVRGVAVKANSARLGGVVRYSARIQTDGGSANYHAFRVEVLAPNRASLKHYGGNLAAPKGQAKGEFVTALNDPVGRWTVRVTDVATGVKGEATVEVAAQ